MGVFPYPVRVFPYADFEVVFSKPGDRGAGRMSYDLSYGSRSEFLKKMNGPSGESNKKPTRLLAFSRIARPPYDDRCLLIFCGKFKVFSPSAAPGVVWFGVFPQILSTANRSISLVIQRFLWRERKAKIPVNQWLLVSTLVSKNLSERQAQKETNPPA